MESKNIITIICAPRTGSNYFCEILNQYINICSNHELFNKIECFINKKYKYIINTELLELRKIDPLMFFNKIISEMKEPIISHKMLLDQCKDIKLIDSIIKQSKFIIFLHRNPIDQYISLLKAYKSTKWIIADTTNIKIRFDISEYNNNEKIANSMYVNIKDICISNSIKFIQIYYEYFHKMNQKDQVEYLSLILTNYIDIDIIIKNNYYNIFKKQDLSKSYADKIENYEEVKDFIENELTNYSVKTTS